jgi:hypothetical protein
VLEAKQAGIFPDLFIGHCHCTSKEIGCVKKKSGIFCHKKETPGKFRWRLKTGGGKRLPVNSGGSPLPTELFNKYNQK